MGESAREKNQREREIDQTYSPLISYFLKKNWGDFFAIIDEIEA